MLKTDQFLPIRVRVKRKLVAWGSWLKFWDSSDQSPSESD